MARLFDDGSSEYLNVDNNLGITDFPYTISAWFRSNDDTAEGTIAWIGDKDSGVEYGEIVASGALYGDVIAAANRSTAGGLDAATTSTQFTVDTWHHACGVFTNATSRAAFIDGGSKGTNATNISPSGYDRLSVGRRADATPQYFFSGDVCEVAVWNVALTDVEVAQLGAGYSPLFIRPESLVGYWPLIRGLEDRISSLSLTASGTAVSEQYPNIIRPALILPSYPTEVVAGNAGIMTCNAGFWGPTF